MKYRSPTIPVAFESVCLNATQFGGHGFGGYYRTSQIMELLSDAGCDVRLIDRSSIFFSRAKRMRTWLQLWKDLRNLSLRDQHRVVHDFLVMRHVLRGGHKILITEGIVDRLKFKAALSSGVPVVCFPECWTALLPGYRDSLTGAVKEDALKLQRILYEKVDGVGWISREELWLGRNLGLTGEYVPYYPCVDHHANLSEIRQKRKEKGALERYLIIATENNSDDPERAFTEQVRILSAVAEAQQGMCIDVVGYAADKYRHFWNHPCFKVHGRVSREEMARFMTECRALLIHGFQGIGTITRIVDCLVAGIPVVANGVAARSAFGLRGLSVYDSGEEFLAALDGANAEAVLDPIELRRKAQVLGEMVRGVWTKRFEPGSARG